MESELKDIIDRQLKGQNFDCLSLGIINFAKASFFCLEHYPSSFFGSSIKRKVYYDLASLTKPLTLGATYCKEPEIFHKDESLRLLLDDPEILGDIQVDLLGIFQLPEDAYRRFAKDPGEFLMDLKRGSAFERRSFLLSTIVHLSSFLTPKSYMTQSMSSGLFLERGFREWE